MEERIQVSTYGYIVINSIQNLFHKNQRYYSLKYIENGVEIVSANFDIRTLTSIMTSLFGIQSFIQHDENFDNTIPIYPSTLENILIYRYIGYDYVVICINNKGAFKVNNGYIGNLFSGIEDIFLDSTIPNNDYFL